MSNLLVRGLDINGDWLFGNGVQSYRSNAMAVAQNIQTRLLSFLGDCFFATNAGINWFNLLGSKNQVVLNLTVNVTILNTPYVTGITQISLILNAARHISLAYNATTAFGSVVTGNTVFNPTDYLSTESGSVIETESGGGISA